MKSTNCLACNKIFVPSWHGRNKACSRACKNILISKNKQKYTPEQIDHVISMKKIGRTNNDIVEETKVKLSKVKEIVKKYGLLMTAEARQNNAYNAKINKNPNAMSKMRLAYGKKVRSAISLEKAKQIVADRGYEYVGGFTSISKPFIVKCLQCNKNKTVSKINTIVKNSCSSCSGTGTSMAEKEIQEWLSSLGVPSDKFKFKERAGGREIDIHVPSARIGIEYCGLYWHNEQSPSPRLREYHKTKMKKANDEGIRLITIFQDEWTNRNRQVKNFIKSAIGIHNQKVFARKCTIKEISKEESNNFLKSTHIQGSGKTHISFGIFLEEELLGVITGAKHHRNNQKECFVLNRMSFKDGVLIVGGASKLTSRLLEYAKKEGYKKLISWSDNRWSEGNVYKKLGFTLEEELGPDYSYVNGQNRISKQSCQKKDLLKMGAIGNTESEMAISIGLYRIWDCGKKRWTIDLTDK